jgi:hypothetical protein
MNAHVDVATAVAAIATPFTVVLPSPWQDFVCPDQHSTIAEPGVAYDPLFDAAFKLVEKYHSRDMPRSRGYVVVRDGGVSSPGDIVYFSLDAIPRTGREVLLSSNTDSGYPAILRFLVRATKTAWHVKEYDRDWHATESIIRRSEFPRCHARVGVTNR